MHPLPKPNFTAWFVMQGIITTMRHPDFQDIADESALALYTPLADAASKTRWITRLSTKLPYTWQHRIMELATNPGRLAFFCFRKRSIEKQTRKLFAEKNIAQVIVLGAGLDILSLRLAQEYPEVKFIEIDTKESQDFKAATFQTVHIPLPQNVEFIAGDLRNPLAEILAPSKLYSPQARTLWIAEGFLMFIPEESVIRIFEEIRQVSPTGSYVIFTTIPYLYSGSTIASWIQKYVMKKEKATYAWAITPENVSNFIENLHYTLSDRISYELLQKDSSLRKKQIKKRLIEDIHIAFSQKM